MYPAPPTTKIFSAINYAFLYPFKHRGKGFEENNKIQQNGLVVDIGRIIFHPRVLGAIFILLIASQTIRLIVPKGKG